MVSGHMCMTFGYLSMNYASCKYYSPPRVLRWRQRSGERERYEHDTQQGSENSEGIWVWYVNAIRLAIPPEALVLSKKVRVVCNLVSAFYSLNIWSLGFQPLYSRRRGQCQKELASKLRWGGKRTVLSFQLSTWPFCLWQGRKLLWVFASMWTPFEERVGTVRNDSWRSNLSCSLFCLSSEIFSHCTSLASHLPPCLDPDPGNQSVGGRWTVSSSGPKVDRHAASLWKGFFPSWPSTILVCHVYS